MTRPRARRLVLGGLKLGVSMGLLALILSSLDMERALGRLQGAQAWMSIPALALLQVQALGAAQRWRLALGVQGWALPFARCWRNVLLGLFVNQALPSTFGGDALRVWHGWRLGLPLGLATRSLITDRVFSFVGLIGVCVAGLPFLASKTDDPVVISGLLSLVLGGLACLVILLSLRFVPARLAGMPALAGAVALSRGAWAVLLTPRVAPAVAGLMVLPHVLDISVVWLATHALGTPVPWLALALVVPPAILTSAVPVSIAGWGLREGALVVGFGLLGLPADLALTCSVLYGLSAVVTGGIGGLIWATTDPEGLRGAFTQKPPEQDEAR